MSRYSDALTAMGELAQSRLTETHAAREKALPLSRDIIRLCANSIRATHRREFDQAKALLKQIGAHLDGMRNALEQNQEIYQARYVEEAQKEYTEAWATLAFVSGAPLQGPDDLRVEIAPYLNGLAEAASELRRVILDALRKNDIAPCEEWMEAMDEVYSLLITIDFPDAITGGLRRTTDQLRPVLERTRGDLTMALRQHSLEQQLTDFQDRVENP